MNNESNIEWTRWTWNWIQGCTKKTIEIDGQIKLREECRNCYMYRQKKQYGQKPQIVVRSAPATFYKPFKFQKQLEAERAAGKEITIQDRLVFTCSWSDFFNPEADDWRPEAWEVIRQCPDLIFQILTKLIDRVKDHLPPFWDEIKNRVWMGYSAGYQEPADWGIPYLIEIDSAVRFLSMEPLLGPVNLMPWILCDVCGGTTETCAPVPDDGLEDFDFMDCPVCQGGYDTRLSWVIVGGESGPGARPTHPNWIRNLRDQCQAAGIPFFLKQWGEFIPKIQVADLGNDGVWRVRPDWLELVRDKKWGCLDIDGKYLEETTTWNGRQNDPGDNCEVTVYKIGKKAAGRLLDGQEWSQFPE